MMKNAKRFLSLLLAVSMVFGLLVFPTSATEIHTHEHTEDANTVSTKEDIKVESNLTIVPLKTEGVEVDEENPAIIAVSKELDDMLVLNADGQPTPLTEEQKQQILGMFQMYLDQWEENAHLLGVQVPFFLQYNDKGEDGLGILGEMLALANTPLEAVRAGYLTFDDLSGMIMNFYYGDQLGLQFYGNAIASKRDEVMKLINNSGALTDVQKLLVLNDWLAHNVTFDMPYIMNTDKDTNGDGVIDANDDNVDSMVAADPQPHEHYDDVYDVMYQVYEASIRDTFEGQIRDGMKAEMKKQFYIAAIEQGVYNSVIEQATAAAIEQALPDVTAAVRQGVYDEVYAQVKAQIEQQIYDAAYADFIAKNHEHDYAENWTWTEGEDGTWTATVTVTCAEGEEVYENVAAEVVVAEGETLTYDPTCTAAGQVAFIAKAEITDANGEVTVVDDTKTIAVPALGHDYNEETQVCNRCGKASDEHEHNYNKTFYWNFDETTGEVTSVTFDATCTLCGDVQEPEVSLTTNSRTDATCTEDGSANITAAAVLEGTPVTETKDVVLNALGHTKKEVAAVEATCTTAGTTAGVVCEVCDAVISGCEEVDVLPHTEVAIGEAKEATCTEAGMTAGVQCSVCETIIEAQTVIPALGHNFVDGKCAVCGETDPDAHVHSYTETVTTPATCGDDGVKTLTCECGDTKTEVIPATGEHVDNFADDVCDVCGKDIVVTGDVSGDTVDVSEEVAAAADEYAKAAVAAEAENTAAQADAAATDEADKYVEEHAEEINQMAADAIANDADAQAQLKAVAESETEKFMTENEAAINADPVAFADSFGEEAAAEMAAAWEATWPEWEANGIPGAVGMFSGEIWPAVIKQFYIQGMTQQGMTEEQATTQAEQVMEADKEAIATDPYGYCVEKFGQEAADQAQGIVNDQLKQMGIDGSAETNPEGRVHLDVIVAIQMETPMADLPQKPDGTHMTPNEAIPVFADQAALGLTDGVLNYWQGSHIGALGRGTAVCLGYTKAFTYLVQYMNPAIYGVNGANTDMSKAANWKTAEALYYDAEGNLDINANYVVDDVRITFDANVTMYGETQENFNSDHFWNAVKVDGKWYYADPCYTDVYTEVMMRDRVETDGSMNHMYFIFSHSTATELYDGNYSEIKTLYADVSTHTDFEDSWISRIKSNTYFDSGYAYYLYDSTDLITLMQDANSENNNNASDLMNQEYLYKIVRHKLDTTDAGDNGDTDYETLIEFNYKADEDDEESIARVYNGSKMVENVLLTKLYAQHEAEREVYPSIALTCALYNGKIYFNISNVIASYDLSTYEVEIVKEYNTVYGLRDDTNPFGGMAFSVSNADNYDFVVEDHPIAAMTIKADGNMYVSVATNFAFISGKDPHNSEDQSSFGYEFEESNYNAAYNSYQNDQYGDMDYEQFGYEKEINDNDEFMWSANFVEKLQMSHLTGTHNYQEVTVAATCGRNAYTENRCSTCGASEPGSRVEVEDTALAHHFVEFEETYYTKADNGNWNTGRVYVCTVCGFHIEEPTEPDPDADYSMTGTTYEEQKAIYDEQKAIYDEAVATAGHSYVPTDAVWASDYSSVSFTTLECSNICPERKPYLDCLLEDETIKLTLTEKEIADASVIDTIGTCPEGVILVYGASGEVELELIQGKPETFAYTVTTEVQKDPANCDFSTGICPICGDSNVKRLSGKSRVETALKAADLLKATLDVESFDTIILASGENFADALAGSYLANAKNAPILLHFGDSTKTNLEYIQNNLSEDGIVYILGGSAAVPEAVETALTDAGIKFERVKGKSRFDTNLAILEKAGITDEEILVATGWNFADSLSVSATGLPILMVNTNDGLLTEAQIEFLTKYSKNKVTIIGGTGAVSEKLEAAIAEIVEGEIDRVYGKTREATSVAVAEKYFNAPKYALVAYSQNFPDGLCGGPVAYALGAPLLLTKTDYEDITADYIAKNEIKAGYIIGGAAALSEESAKVCFGITSELEIPKI